MQAAILNIKVLLSQKMFAAELEDDLYNIKKFRAMVVKLNKKSNYDESTAVCKHF